MTIVMSGGIATEISERVKTARDTALTGNYDLAKSYYEEVIRKIDSLLPGISQDTLRHKKWNLVSLNQKNGSKWEIFMFLLETPTYSIA